MATQLGAELTEEIRKTFSELIGKSKTAKTYIERFEKGIGTIVDADRYAYEVGQNLTKAFLENLTVEVLPDGRISYSLAKEFMPPMLEEEFNLVTDATQKIITKLNREAGINLNAVRPNINWDRVEGLVSGIGNSETLEDAYDYLRSPVQNFAVHAVDDTIRHNADFQYKSGLQPRIIRSTDGTCCEWCNSLAGSYDYPPKNAAVWQRHENCNCVISYQPTKMKARRQTLVGGLGKGWQEV